MLCERAVVYYISGVTNYYIYLYIYIYIYTGIVGYLTAFSDSTVCQSCSCRRGMEEPDIAQSGYSEDFQDKADRALGRLAE